MKYFILLFFIFTSQLTPFTVNASLCDGDHAKQEQLGHIVLKDQYNGINFGYLCEYSQSTLDKHPYLPTFHAGIDYSADPGDDVYAAIPGTLSYCGTKLPDCALLIPDSQVEGEDIKIFYLHVSDPMSSGHVEEGDKIADVADMSGAHLHIEIRINYWGSKAIGNWTSDDGTPTGSCDGVCNTKEKVRSKTIDPGSILLSPTVTNFSPTSGSTLYSTEQLFAWENFGADSYWLDIGSEREGYDLFCDHINDSFVNVKNLPSDGRTLCVTLWALVKDKLRKYEYTYTAYLAPDKANLINPPPGSTLDSPTQTFTCENTGAEAYWLDIGSSVGGKDLYSDGKGKILTQTITGLPSDERPLFVRLWSKKNGNWLYNNYTYSAGDGIFPYTGDADVNGFTMPISENYKTDPDVIYVYLADTGLTYGCANGTKKVYHPGYDFNVEGTSGDEDKGTNIYAVADGIAAIPVLQ